MGAMVYDCDGDIRRTIQNLFENGASRNEVQASLAYWFHAAERMDPQTRPQTDANYSMNSTNN